MGNEELMELLKKRGYSIKSPSSTIDKISAEALLTEFADRVVPDAVVPDVAAAPVSLVTPVAPPASPPPSTHAGIIKTVQDLDRERHEREAAEAAARAPRPVAPPNPPVAVAGSGPPGASRPPPLPAFRAPPPLPPRTPMPGPRLPTPSSAGGPPVVRPAPAMMPLRPPSSSANNAASGVTLPRARIQPGSRPNAGPTPAAKSPSAPTPPSKSPPPVTSSAAGAPPTLPVTAVGAEPESDGGGKIIQVKPPIIVRDFATMLGLKPFRLISELMEMNIFASMNQAVEEEVATRLARRHGKKPEPPPEDETKFLEPRPPIVCVLGHVNHGKTSLLDAIRQTNVVAGEAGGITQHTGAYQVEHKNHKITFLDTPGHAAFAKMRERGANLTDIAVLVVAADDGFMPQTDEALLFAQKAGVPVVVAINKIDAKGANLDRVKQAMQQRGITSEDWGGETLCVPVSALKREHIPELLDALLLQAEIMELKANPKAPAEGVVVDSQVEIGRGATATVIVLKGTLKPGEAMVCGTEYCKVRAMVDDRDQPMKAAPPGTPVRLLGWSGAPEAGAKFRVYKHDREAKAEAETAARAARLESLGVGSPSLRAGDLEALLKAIHETKQKVFRCVVKGDVHGTKEALEACLADIKSDKVKLEVVAADVGPISKNDVIMASAAEAAVVGFNVKLENGVAPLAKHKGVRLIQHDIIYELLNQVRAAMAELLDPELRESKIGAAEVRQVFPVAKGFVAGCMVTEGRIARDGHARLLRAGAPVHTGRIGTLKRFKDDAGEVRAGFECGIRLEGCNDYQVGDVIECFEILQIRPEL
jgi:translation initiation factor IF-2